jgi:hypothetical protein
MVSPFLGFQNATITLNYANGTTSTDANGNIVEGKTTVNCAVLLEKTSDFGWEKLPGIDVGGIAVKGYFVNPQFIPANVPLPWRYPCVRDGISGEILLYTVIRDPWGASLETGDPIRGYFRVGGFA